MLRTLFYIVIGLLVHMAVIGTQIDFSSIASLFVILLWPLVVLFYAGAAIAIIAALVALYYLVTEVRDRLKSWLHSLRAESVEPLATDRAFPDERTNNKNRSKNHSTRAPTVIDAEPVSTSDASEPR